jgi:hypothetical protein
LNIDFKLFSTAGPELAHSLRYEELHDFTCYDPYAALGVVWKFLWPLRTWSGFMHGVAEGDHPFKSSITFLPMTDMNPGDMNCVSTTLQFLCREARRPHVRPVLTFDQPLWWKAQLVVLSEPEDSEMKHVVLRLG